MSKIYCPHAFNAMEITTIGEFSPCCVSSKKFVDDAGKQYHAGDTSISEVYASNDRRKWIEQFDVNFKTDCKQCWEVEKGGGESKRLREINYWKLLRKTNISPNSYLVYLISVISKLSHF